MEQRQKLMKRSKTQSVTDIKHNLDKSVLDKPVEVTNDESFNNTNIKETSLKMETITSDSDSTNQNKEYYLSDISVIPKEFLQAQIEYVRIKKALISTYSDR